MICATQTLLCGVTCSGRNAAISTEALKRHCSSSVDLAFKLSDLKPEGDDGGGNDETGNRSRRYVPVSHPLHTLLLINSSLLLVRDREEVESLFGQWLTPDTHQELLKAAALGLKFYPAARGPEKLLQTLTCQKKNQ